MIKPRKVIEELKPYKAVQINADYILNANETENYLYKNGFSFNENYALYPEAQADKLRQKISEKYAMTKEEVIVGNGSTQLLELVIRTYCEQLDNIITFTPTFSMYEIYAKAQNVNLISVPLESNLKLDPKNLITIANKNNAKIIILCNPNNPTGSIISKEDILSIINQTNALVIVDEAYMEFASEQESVTKYINDYDRLIVARTFSKAYGLASIRLGYLLSNKDIIATLLKMSLPYNVNGFTQQVGLDVLDKENEMRNYVDSIISERNRVLFELNRLNINTFESFTNFIYLYSEKDLFRIFLKQGVLIRSFQNNYYRITIQSKEANDKIIQVLKEVSL